MGMIFDIKQLGVFDGDGLRTTVFFKGCPLKCVWCHNPEGQKFEKQIMVRENSCKHCGLCLQKCDHLECQPFNRCVHICPDNLVNIVGKELAAKELCSILLENKDFYKNGGVTFSGGEPLAQPDFLLETIDLLKGINIAIETSGYVDSKTFKKVIDRVDCVYMDLKLIDEQQHIKYTGVSNKLILENLEILRNSKVKKIIRTPLIPNITDTKENLEAIERLVKGMMWEKLEYNEFAGVKYKMLNIPYPLEGRIE